MTSGHPREPFWYAMTEPQRATLFRIGTQRLHEPEEVILRERDHSDFALVLLDGCVKVSATARHGYQAILGLRDAGELLGELAGADGSHRSATLTALTEVTALHLPGAEFGRFLRDQPDAAAVMRRTLAARLREADRYRAAAGAEPAQQRLAELLLHLARRYGVPVNDGGLLIELPLSQEDLAGLALTSLRTLGRILEQWRNLDLVVTGRRRVLVLAPARFARLVPAPDDR